MRPDSVLASIALLLVIVTGSVHAQAHGPAASSGGHKAAPKPPAAAPAAVAVEQTPTSAQPSAAPGSYAPAAYSAENPYGAAPTLYPPAVPGTYAAPGTYGTANAYELRSAEAAPAGAPKTLRLGLLLGYGVSFDDLEPWHFGLGVTFGGNLGQVHLGARFAHHFGKAEDDAHSVKLWELAAVIGYDFAIGESFSVRPYVSPGLAALIMSYADSEVSGEFALAAGVTALYDIGDTFSIGADLKLQHVFSDPGVTGFIFMATAGARL